ncbi:MAG: extracellular solute-binding protein, partial [Clostridia bacterium]|nr:extracellular solute-binding protein [Clostridia bacterium]
MSMYQMNLRQRTQSALLALLCLAATAMASCGDASTVAVDTASVTPTETETVETEAVDPRLAYANVAPAVEDFGGYGYRMSVLVDNDVVFKQVAYWSEGENGDTLNDAVYKRNLAVEEAYNVKISLIQLADTNATVRKNIQAADDFSDIIFPSNIGELLSLAQQGCFLDLNMVDELQLDQPWWDQRIQDLAIHGKLYCATGDISIRDELREMAVLYNKTLYTQFDYPDPYDLVADNKWTWETMASMIRDVAKDVNGDGDMTTADQYGLISENIAGWYLFLASGRDSISYDGKTYTSDIEDASIYNIFEDIFEVLCDKKSVIIMDDGTHEKQLTTETIWTEATKIFSENRALFRTGTFGDTV